MVMDTFPIVRAGLQTDPLSGTLRIQVKQHFIHDGVRSNGKLTDYFDATGAQLNDSELFVIAAVQR
jgi:hypothetical protein